jgi:hypothetical protein
MADKALFFVLFLALTFAVPAFAEEKSPATAPTPAATSVNPSTPVADPAPQLPPTGSAEKIPDTSKMLFVQNIRKAGATIYYLGQALGMDGWFAVKDNQVQLFYTSLDQKAIVVGALLSAEGANISQQQILLLAQSKPEIKSMMEAQTPPQPSAATAPSAAPADPNASPSEQLMAEVKGGATVSFGKAEAPELIMIMDVMCPHCHDTWKKLSPLVDQGKLRVIMFPIIALGPESKDKAAMWLAMKDPQDAWKKHVAGDDKILAGTPAPEKSLAVIANMQIAQKWKVSQTPYILYKGKNGKVRLVVGEPKDVNAIISDIK